MFLFSENLTLKCISGKRLAGIKTNAFDQGYKEFVNVRSMNSLMSFESKLKTSLFHLALRIL